MKTSTKWYIAMVVCAMLDGVGVIVHPIDMGTVVLLLGVAICSMVAGLWLGTED